MSALKLLNIDTLNNGTIRLQSQLLVGKDVSDFIIEDGILKNYCHGNRGFDFYEYKKPYIIVTNINEMRIQEL